MLYAEKAPGSTWMKPKEASNGLSIKWAKWYYTCCVRWISANFSAMFVRKSTSSLFISSFSYSFYIFRLMYPHTPPTFGFSRICLNILNKASPSGLSPTSSKTAYFGLSSLQKPLKNQLWDDNLPLFLYLTHMNKFI